MFTDDEFFGSAERIALSKRSANLWLLLRHNPRYAYYGRLVALSDPAQDTADPVRDGETPRCRGLLDFYPVGTAGSLFAQLEEGGWSRTGMNTSGRNGPGG